MQGGRRDLIERATIKVVLYLRHIDKISSDHQPPQSNKHIECYLVQIGV